MTECSHLLTLSADNIKLTMSRR